MDLKHVLQAAIENAFNTVGVVKQRITYVTKSDGNNNTTNEKNTLAENIHLLDVLVVTNDDGLDLLINNYLSFTPDTNDEIIYKGEKYIVETVLTDPVNAHHSIKAQII